MLSEEFYQRPALQVAPDLLGRILVYQSSDGEVAGEIVETESYSEEDPASHSYGGLRTRNRPMFGPAGTAYVYRIYGIHLCFNIVTGLPGQGEAVLIRALRPLRGIELMESRRRTQIEKRLCSGPGNVCAAFGITLADNEQTLLTSRFYVEAGSPLPLEEIMVSPRIGIQKAAELPWRFFQKNSPYVSGSRAALRN